jgi:hypothetical protein
MRELVVTQLQSVWFDHASAVIAGGDRKAYPNGQLYFDHSGQPDHSVAGSAVAAFRPTVS